MLGGAIAEKTRRSTSEGTRPNTPGESMINMGIPLVYGILHEKLSFRFGREGLYVGSLRHIFSSNTCALVLDQTRPGSFFVSYLIN